MWYIESEADGRRYELDREIIIGREVGDVLVPASDARVSRQHAAVRMSNDSVEVEDLGSLNGTFIDEVRIDGTAAWQASQILRCGRTTFRLCQYAAAVTRERYADSQTSEAPVASQQVVEEPVRSEPIAVAVPKSVERPGSPPVRLADRDKPRYIADSTQSSGSGSAISGIVLGLLLLIAGVYGWQHYQPKIDMINSVLGQFAVGVGGNSAAGEAEKIRLYYTASIVSACLGAVMVLGYSIALAVRRR